MPDGDKHVNSNNSNNKLHVLIVDCVLGLCVLNYESRKNLWQSEVTLSCSVLTSLVTDALITTLQVRRQRSRKVRCLAQGHKASK